MENINYVEELLGINVRTDMAFDKVHKVIQETNTVK